MGFGLKMLKIGNIKVRFFPIKIFQILNSKPLSIDLDKILENYSVYYNFKGWQ